MHGADLFSPLSIPSTRRISAHGPSRCCWHLVETTASHHAQQRVASRLGRDVKNPGGEETEASRRRDGMVWVKVGGARGPDGGEVPVATDVCRRGGWARQEEKPSKISPGRGPLRWKEEADDYV